MASFSGVLLPVVLAVLLLLAYRPLLSSPAPGSGGGGGGQWHALHGADAVALGHRCTQAGLTLECTKWMFDGQAAAQFGVFEPVTLLYRALLVSFNGAPLNVQSFHFTSLLLHLATGILLLFTTERFLALLLEEPQQPRTTAAGKRAVRSSSRKYRAPSCFAAAWWLLSPQRVEAVAWFSADAFVLAGFCSLLCLWLLLRAAASTSSSVRNLYRFAAWVSYVAACWSQGGARALVAVIVLLDACLLLPRERRIAAAAAPEAGKANFVMDVLHACLRNGAFLAAFLLCSYLATTAQLQSLLLQADPLRAASVSIPALWIGYLAALANPRTIVPRLTRTLLSLGWYARQSVHPTDLHVFTTRLVPLSHEGPERLLMIQGEIVDVMTVGLGLATVVAFLLGRKHRSLAFGLASWLMLLLPHTALFDVTVVLNQPSEASSLSSSDAIVLSPAAPHIWVADRWAYLAAALLAPAIARAVLRSEDAPATVTPTAQANAAAQPAATATAAASNGKQASGGKKGAGAAKTAAAPSTAAVSASAATAAPTPGSFHFMLPRVILFLLVCSTGLFVLHATPSHVPSFSSVPASCAATLAVDGDVVECHEALGLAAFKAGPAAWPQALRFLDLERLEELRSRSVVALVVRARILAEGVLPAPDPRQEEAATEEEEEADEASSSSSRTAAAAATAAQAPKAKPSASAIAASVQQTFERALTLQPNSAFLLQEWAGLAYEKLRQPALARALLERCVSAHPSHTPCATALNAFTRKQQAGDSKAAETGAQQEPSSQAA